MSQPANTTCSVVVGEAALLDERPAADNVFPMGMMMTVLTMTVTEKIGTGFLISFLCHPLIRQL